MSSKFLCIRWISPCMQKEGVLKWISRGRQRRILAKVLLKPMTAGEIWQEARRFNPRIQLRDVCSLLRRFMEKGLVYCLAYEEVKGSIFFWTEYGMEIVPAVLGIELHAPVGIDWKVYSFVVRAKIRRLIVKEMSRSCQKQHGWTAEDIRRVLSNNQAFGLRSITRALKGLETHQVIECAGFTKVGRRKLYRLTNKGSSIGQQWTGSPTGSGSPDRMAS